MWPATRPVIPTGDIEAACIDILKQSTLLSPFNPSISTDLVGVGKSLPPGADPNVNPTVYTRWITVSREGGFQRFPHDFPRIDLNVIAKKRTDAFDIASVARAELFAAAGYSGHGLRILAAQEEVGLVRSADLEETGLFRYFSSLRFTTRAIT